MRRTIVALALLAALPGCGKKQWLAEAGGRPLPPRPATAATRPNPVQLLDPGTQARPTRFNDLVIQSRELRADRFDMPPPG